MATTRVEVELTHLNGLSSSEVLRLASVIAVGMTLMLASVASFFLERRHGQRPMFALTLILIAWVMLTLGTATSGVGRLFPPVLVMAPLLSGFTGPALFIYTRQLTRPHRPTSLKWLWLGLFGTTYSVLSLSIPDGLHYATEAIVHQRPYWHPLLSPFMTLQSLQLAVFVLISTALITHAVWTRSRPDLRQTQFWLLVTCWTSVGIVVLTNVLPTFQILLVQVEPALVTLPITVVGCLGVRALGVELRAVQESQVEDRANRMESLGRMARGLSHDLNNILTATIGHAEVAKLKLPTDAPATSNLHQIIEGSQRAAQLLRRMMTYSGRVDRELPSIDPRAALEAAFHAIAPLQGPHCHMKVTLSATLPAISIEPHDLSNAVDNLLVNATEALEDGRGHVTLRAFEEASPQLPHDTYGASLTGTRCLRIEVEDSGRGMTPAQAARALEPFYSSRSDGKGLGLVGVLSTVKGAGGALWFSSQLGAGSRFVIWLPATEVAATEDRDSVTSILGRALVVDDEPEIRRVLSQLLDSMGIRAFDFASGEEAIEFLKQANAPKFELAIVDIRLGAMDGIELGHRLIHDHGCAGILLMSGDEPGPRLAQFNSHAVVFQRKPLTLRNIEDSLAVLDLAVSPPPT